jgi:Flp pilus assembly protein TadB
MTTRHNPRATDREAAPDDSQPGRGRHSWMMIACCIPILVIAVILVATGVVSAGFLGIVIGCTLMMALMMRGMGRGGGGTST